MPRSERLEDLGRIRAMLDQLMSDDFWELQGTRRIKDYPELHEKMSADEQVDYVMKILYGRQSVEEKLHEILCISRGYEDNGEI